MSEFDELVSGDGVLVAGRFGPDWRVAETKSQGLFVEYPPALEVMGSFLRSDSIDVQCPGDCHGWLQSLGLDSRPWLGHFRRQLLDWRTR
jgi:hypothetical protein